MGKDSAPTIRDLYPTLNEEEVHRAEDNLARYIALALRVYERVVSDPAAYAQFRNLTARTRTLPCTRTKGDSS